MIRDITIGQYFPGKSTIHKMDPRGKIIYSLILIVTLFVSQHILGIVIATFFVVGCYELSKIPLSLIVKSLKPIVPVIVFTALLNMFFIPGTAVWDFGFVQITLEGINMAVLMVSRILCLIAGTTLLTYTTSPIALTDGIERLLNPLKKIKVPVHELAMMMTIALRFIPTLVDETDKIISAQKARGADMETGSLAQRTKALLPILIPLFISSFRRADELALAMECRCYQGGEGRTRMKQLKWAFRDCVATLVMLGLLALIIYLNTVLYIV